MVQVKYSIVFWYAIGNILLYCKSDQFKNQNVYGAMTNAYPKSSCMRINDIDLVIHCLQTCMTNVGIYYMSSYNREKLSLLCWFFWKWNNRFILEHIWNEQVFAYSKYSIQEVFFYLSLEGGGGNFMFWGDYYFKEMDICLSF